MPRNQKLLPIEQVCETSFQRELHRLLRLKPFVNNGMFEAGWSCRDHAWVLSAVLAAHNTNHEIAIGRAMVTRGADETGPALALGIPSDPNAQVAGHAWLHIADQGILDLSINTRVRHRLIQSWKPVEFNGVVRSRWIPSGGGHVVVVPDGNYTKYKQAIDLSSHLRNDNAVIYMACERSLPTSEFYRSPGEFTDSPLFHFMTRTVGEGVHAHAVLHLLGFMDGVRRPLGGLSQKKAWRILSEDYPNALKQLESSLSG